MSEVLPDRDAVDGWAQRHFGLSLENYPTARGKQLAELLALHPTDAWDSMTDEAAAILSIPETHFHRHPECFAAMRVRLKDVAADRPRGPIRVWSAGCASGEEAYNLAAVAREVVGDRVRVFGTDFSQDAVGRARAGVYGTWSLRGNDLTTLPWLEPSEDGRYQVKDEVRKLVTFNCGTLAEPGPPYEIDIAFCRNVLIYFSDEGCGRVLRRIASCLRADGVLLTAPTDPVPSELGRWRPVRIPAPRTVRAYLPPKDTEHVSESAGGRGRNGSLDIANHIKQLLGG